MSETKAVEKWSNQIAWVKSSDYIVRCIEETFSESKSSGNPMITLEFEVAAPETMSVGDKEILIAGVKAGLKAYYPVTVLSGDGIDDQKTANSRERVKTLYRAFGLLDTDINYENPTLAFKGKIVYAWLEDDETEQRKSPTKDELAKGIKQGAVMINPVTKKPLVQHYPKIREIFGLAPEDANKPY